MRGLFHLFHWAAKVEDWRQDGYKSRDGWYLVCDPWGRKKIRFWQEELGNRKFFGF